MKKKMAQAARREAKKVGEAYQNEIKKRMTILNTVLRKRPWFVPLFIWRILGKIVLDMEAIKKYIGQK